MNLLTTVKVARGIHILSSLWVFVLALVILIDVFGRILFLSPLPGTKEILQNSVIFVTFLQLPLAIYSGSMLRTTLIVDAMPPVVQRLLRTLCYVLGFALFAAVAYASVPQVFDAYRLGEYEGEGSLRIYTWPIRSVIAITTIFAAIAYASMIYADWRGDLGADDSLTNA